MSSKRPIDDPLFPALLESYRGSIRFRYSKEFLKTVPELKPIPQETVDKLLVFFLEHVYPTLEKRKALDEAFGALAGFIREPAKIWGILGNLAMAIFRFGRMFPQALRAGLSALHSYTTAHDLESRLMDAMRPFVKEHQRNPTEAEFRIFLSTIPEREAKSFRGDVIKLFSIFGNMELVDRVTLILADVLQRMEKKPNLYQKADRDGVSLGIEILKLGRSLFWEMSLLEIKNLVEGIEKVERCYWEGAILADGRSRTDTMLPPVDFESTASTNSTTSAD